MNSRLLLVITVLFLGLTLAGPTIAQVENTQVPVDPRQTQEVQLTPEYRYAPIPNGTTLDQSRPLIPSPGNFLGSNWWWMLPLAAIPLVLLFFIGSEDKDERLYETKGRGTPAYSLATYQEVRRPRRSKKVSKKFSLRAKLLKGKNKL